MHDNRIIYVPFFAHKLEVLLTYAKNNEHLNLPKKMTQLGKKLNERSVEVVGGWSKTFNKTASANCKSVERLEAPTKEHPIVGRDANKNDQKLTLKTHKTILEIFGLEWPNRFYWDEYNVHDRDLSLRKFKRSFWSTEEKIDMAVVRRNHVYARNSLFTMEIEDISTDRHYTGRISVHPLDDKMPAQPLEKHQDPTPLDYKLQGEIVGSLGLGEFFVHVEGPIDASVNAHTGYQEITEFEPHIEIFSRTTHTNPSWQVKTKYLKDKFVRSNSAFTVGEFNIREIKFTEAVHIYSICQKPTFSISNELPLNDGETAETYDKYQRIAAEMLKETFEDFEHDPKFLTLAHISLKRDRT